MVGNVWEWVDETVIDATYAGRSLPPGGYVTGVDSDGVAVTTAGEIPDEAYNEDYFWLAEIGAQGMFRGGHWQGGTDAGIYTVYAGSPPSFAGGGVGFRCAR